MNPLWLLASVFGFLQDKQTQDKRNAEALAREEALTQRVDTGQADVTQAASTMPSFTFGGHEFVPPGAPRYRPSVGSAEAVGTPPINLDEAFKAGSSALTAFDVGRSGLDTKVSPLGLDFSGMGGSISDILNRAKLAPGTLASRVDMPDSDLSSLLAADIAGQGTASKGRLDAQRASLASAAPQLGGLEGVERENRSLDFTEGSNRALQAAGSTASTRTQEAQIEEFIANLQGTLGAKEADINAGLAGTEVSGLLGAGQLNLQGAMGERAIEEGNINRDLDLFLKRTGLVAGAGTEDTQRLMTALDLLLKQSGATQGAAGANLSADLGYGNLLAGSGLIGQNDVSWQNMINNFLTALSASEGQPKPKGSFSLTVAGFGGGGGCVAGCMPVMTLQGSRPLKEIKIGQLVIGADGKYHRVHDMEYGYLEEKDRTHKHLILVTNKSYLWITENHPVCGKPAGEWKVGDKMVWINERGEPEGTTVTYTAPAPYVPSGDLLLDGGGEYMVMGYPISSVIQPGKESKACPV